MRRREALAAGAVGMITTTSGCLGHSTEDRGLLHIDKRGQATDGECIEEELLDFVRIRFPAGYTRLFGFDNAVQWSVEMEEGEELYLRITSSNMDYPPELEVTDPAGATLLDSDDASQNIHRIESDTAGTYTIWIGDRRTSGGEYFVDVSWHNAVGCSDPYAQLENDQV